MREYKVSIDIEREYYAENKEELIKLVNENYDDVEEDEMIIEEVTSKESKVNE